MFTGNNWVDNSFHLCYSMSYKRSRQVVLSSPLTQSTVGVKRKTHMLKVTVRKYVKRVLRYLE